jgi:hypothetical protein
MSLENERRTTQSLSEELTLYKAYYASAIAQRDAHAMRANRLQLMYDTMASSASWKMTKPLRATLDLLKKIFRRIFRR